LNIKDVSIKQYGKQQENLSNLPYLIGSEVLAALLIALMLLCFLLSMMAFTNSEKNTILSLQISMAVVTLQRNLTELMSIIQTMSLAPIPTTNGLKSLVHKVVVVVVQLHHLPQVRVQVQVEVHKNEGY